jgi:hypothetical protein
MKPRVALIDGHWTVTYFDRDTKRVVNATAPSWAVAVRRAVRVATRQGRAL